MVVDTNPTEAACIAPKRPNIEASIYCIKIDESCAMMAGALSMAVSSNCCRIVMGDWLRMSASKSSLV